MCVCVCGVYVCMHVSMCVCVCVCVSVCVLTQWNWPEAQTGAIMGYLERSYRDWKVSGPGSGHLTWEYSNY